jgi:hypothetical protein
VINEQLATLRRYERAEAAQILNIKETWLKRWVTARCIPHQRSGNPDGVQQRGVWFTWADILAIGQMLPELMTERQAKRARLAARTPRRRTRRSRSPPTCSTGGPASVCADRGTAAPRAVTSFRHHIRSSVRASQPAVARLWTDRLGTPCRGSHG